MLFGFVVDVAFIGVSSDFFERLSSDWFTLCDLNSSILFYAYMMRFSLFFLLDHLVLFITLLI